VNSNACIFLCETINVNVEIPRYDFFSLRRLFRSSFVRTEQTAVTLVSVDSCKSASSEERIRNKKCEHGQEIEVEQSQIHDK